MRTGHLPLRLAQANFIHSNGDGCSSRAHQQWQWRGGDSVLSWHCRDKRQVATDLHLGVELYMSCHVLCVLCCAVLCCTLLRRALLCPAVRAVLFYAVLCCAVPCCAVLCCAVGSPAAPCCAVLCCVVPCCSVLQSAMHCHNSPCNAIWESACRHCRQCIQSDVRWVCSPGKGVCCLFKLMRWYVACSTPSHSSSYWNSSGPSTSGNSTTCIYERFGKSSRQALSFKTRQQCGPRQQ